MTMKQFDPLNPNKFAVDEARKFVDAPQTQPGLHLSETSQKMAAKHAADRAAAEAVPESFPVASELDGAEPTPDGLGTWEGGKGKGAANWVSQKSHATNTGDPKNEHGNNPHLGAKPITHRQDQDFCEIHTDANGDFFLYNVEKDAWDIKTDAQTIPFYEDENGKLFAFNYKTGAWDVPASELEDVDEYPASSMQVLEGIEATKRSEAFVPEEEQ